MYVAYYLSIGTFCLEAENADADSAYQTPGDRGPTDESGESSNPEKNIMAHLVRANTVSTSQD
jgi:hypothetical protein